MVKHRLCYTTSMVFAVVFMLSAVTYGFADGKNGVYTEYDDAGRITIESEYQDGQRYRELRYDYFEDGNLKSLREIYGDDKWGTMTEIHYDPTGHVMEFSRLPSGMGMVPGVGQISNGTEPTYQYDYLGRLIQFEADCPWIDAPEKIDHTVYTYLYDEQNRIKSVGIIIIHDSECVMLPTFGTMSFTYGTEGEYIIKRELFYDDGTGALCSSIWLVTFDQENQIIFEEMLYSDDELEKSLYSEVEESCDIQSSVAEAPALIDLKRMLDSGDVRGKSNTGVNLELPSESQMLEEPFRACITNGKTHGSIYVMPKSATGNGHIGTVDIDTEVWILAETKQFYFFMTDDGQMGWNGKSYFLQQ